PAPRTPPTYLRTHGQVSVCSSVVAWHGVITLPIVLSVNRQELVHGGWQVATDLAARRRPGRWWLRWLGSRATRRAAPIWRTPRTWCWSVAEAAEETAGEARAGGWRWGRAPGVASTRDASVLLFFHSPLRYFFGGLVFSRDPGYPVAQG
uniref:Uncharacterized protein n=1 Tax=Aegilops tauschii subsp. strangulata TaxID=200361 RepID=A0A453J2C3_AEGTS